MAASRSLTTTTKSIQLLRFIPVHILEICDNLLINTAKFQLEHCKIEIPVGFCLNGLDFDFLFTMQKLV